MSDRPPMTLLRWLRIVGCGMCMGAADLVPGVSGGTLAFILGIYDEFIGGIKSFDGKAIRLLLSGNLRAFSERVQWRFILAIVCGMVLSFALLAKLFHLMLGHETYRCYLYAAFFGLIIGSIWFCYRQVSKWSWRHVGGLLAGAAASFAVTTVPKEWLQPQNSATYDVYLPQQMIELAGIAQASVPISNYIADRGTLVGIDKATLDAMLSKGVIDGNTKVFSHATREVGAAAEVARGGGSAWFFDGWIMLCGMLAISAMLLPGISGSYLLAILGVYPLVIGALADTVDAGRHLSIDVDAIATLGSLTIGVFFGAVAFSRVVSWMLARYHEVAVAVLTGFMVGAMRAVWPFWTYSYLLHPLKLDRGPQLEVVSPIWPEFGSEMGYGVLAVAPMAACLVVLMERWAGSQQKTS